MVEGHTGDGSLSPARELYGGWYLKLGRPPGGKKEWYQSLTPAPDFMLAVRLRGTSKCMDLTVQVGAWYMLHFW